MSLISPQSRASKFDAVHPRADAIARVCLLRRFAAAADTSIVLICATAGYGKSTLAAQWSARCERPVAWVNLDRGDNNPIVLLTSLAHAIERLDPVDSDLFDELSARAPRVQDVVLPALVAELEHVSPVVLILDDVNELTAPQSLAALNALLEAVQAPSQAVLVTRVDPELPVVRSRAGSDILEIRSRELAFDAGETQALVESSGFGLSAGALELLHERTEGWPAGIVLALHTLDESASIVEVAKTVSGTHREMADYFAEVILRQETEERRHFLLATSVLRRMTASLCDAVLGVTNSSEILAELERSNSFVVALDDHRGWYRYHHLFAELLRSELDRTDPELVTIFLARAAEWHQRDGSDPSEAFRCAHECGDLKLAGRVALAVTDRLVQQGQIETVKRWLIDCSDEEISSDHQLAIVAGWIYLLLGDLERAYRFTAAAAEGDLDDGPSADGAASLRSSLANLRSVLAPGGVHQMLADAEFACTAEEGSPNPRWLIQGNLQIGNANLLLGQPEEAVAAVRAALMLTAGTPGVSGVMTVCLACLAFASAETGNWSEARRSAREAVAVSASEGLDHTFLGGIAFTARAMVLAHDSDFDRASAELAKARHTNRLFGATRWLNADLNLRWGDVSLVLGDRLGAQEHADVARAALHGYPDPGGLPSRLAELDRRIGSFSDLHLTPAEIRILPFLATHLSIKQIAARLHVSSATVKTHVSSVYAKLDATTRSEAVAQMQDLGVHVKAVQREADA